MKLETPQTFCVVISGFVAVLLSLSALLSFFSEFDGLSLQRLWSSYLYYLEIQPIQTKCTTSFIGSVIGDVMAQLLSGKNKYDFLRTVRMGVYGGFVGGPIGHYWFNFLDKVVYPTYPGSPLAIVVKSALDQLIQAPIGLSLFYTYQEVVQGRALRVIREIKQKLFPTLFMTWKFWPLVHLVNFAVIPLEQRMLYVNVVSVVYTCLLSQLASENNEQSTTKRSSKKVA
eukprot:TRINITY_DN9357_c0_g1_i5.p1 TRINITY_DN9357_c0_g1~~TRINITY_DN9357_c0_g1_i5.p1  ORF type:complete len:228 (-),score=9.77 TRINITY_DN9357_c0_g1_i5:334-1017(-)